MQAPFWKAEASDRVALLATAAFVLECCAGFGVRWVVVPLVDNGSVDSAEAAENLADGLEQLAPLLSADRVGIAFESDLGPQELARFMEGLDPALFGVNYDIGNSAALGFDHREEIAAYGARIVNVHVKDRLRGGTTVPLGQGAADLEGCAATLLEAGYAGNWILQTARAADGDHAGALARYRDMVLGWLQGA
jgi:hexulose-6-phosphate isomerase